MSIYQLTIPCFTQMLESLSAQLDKGIARAEAEGFDAAVLMNERLAPDMHPLSAQVRFSCIQATEAAQRLTGQNIVEALPNVDTIESAKLLITQTVSLLATIDRAGLDAAAEKPIEVSLPNGITFDMNGFEYVRDWALPQFYFHLVTAYDILRHNGVDLGKADYVRHIFAYLRQPSSET